jgi:hypothetical protein
MHGGSDEADALWFHSSIRRVLPLCGRLRSLTLDLPPAWGNPDASSECRDVIQALFQLLSEAPGIRILQLDAEAYLSSATIQLLSLLPHLASLRLACQNHIPFSFEEPMTQARFPSLSHLNLSTPLSMAMDFARVGCSLPSFRLECRDRTSADLERWL